MMIDILLIASAIVIGYIVGSIPTAVWIGRYFYQIDVREHGSKNAGATNTFRVLGKKPGIIVLVIDVIKGIVASMFPILFGDFFEMSYAFLISLRLLSSIQRGERRCYLIRCSNWIATICCSSMFFGFFTNIYHL
jgi:glycerol-3-phosphate acyltransferase PlsY